ncbi:MAG: aminotransferase class I/II-fold pyridoxal phosphate-dependent enzyme [Cryomorphaceae bacterium]|nr:aminotransferase class I/II-fold pyridoxal phosphate-dependent enzyme [Cryomorphaceae bacterium]
MSFENSNLTIFAYMSKLAQTTGAINLSQGFPDFPIDPKLIDGVVEAMRQGYNQYAPMPGLPALRNVLAERHATDYGCQYDPETEITITPGATQAIQSVIASVVRHGDEVVLFAPAYDCYAPMVEASGGVVKWVNLNPEDFSVPHDALSDAVGEKTRLIIINNPHNPCGTVWSDANVQHLHQLRQRNDFFVLADEVYEKICFLPGGFSSFGGYEKLRSYTFLVYSFGKTFHATGWKVGYVMAPSELMLPLRKFYQFAVFSVNTPVQHGLAKYIPHADYAQIAKMYKDKQMHFAKIMAATDFKPLPTYGSYYQLYDYSAVSELDDISMAEWLTREKGVATIPISVFYPTRLEIKYLRFCFAKQNNVLEEAGKRLEK